MNHSLTASSAALAASLGLALGLCACAPSTEESASVSSAGGSTAAMAAAASAAAAGAHDAELVTAVALGKTQMPMNVRFRLETRPVVGQPLTIELVVTPAQLAQIRGLQFRLQPGTGLLLQGDAELSLTGATPGLAVRRELVVVPQSAGVLELELLATVETNSETLTQTYAIPLIAQQAVNPG